MVVDELLEYIAPDGWAGFVPDSVRALEVGTVSGDNNIAGVIDIYVKEER